MTEQTFPSAPDKQSVNETESSLQPNTSKPPQKNKGGAWLSIIAILLVIALGIGGYYHTHRQARQLNSANQHLQQQLNALQQQLTNQENQLQLQAKTLDNTENSQASLTRQFNMLQQKVATISNSDPKTWLLAQADFLVKMAGRKLWGDQDVLTASILLKSADASLADMNDPSLIDVRRAITEDISALSAATQIDYDGISLKLNQLINQVDDLRVADSESNQAPMDQNDGELTASLSEWRQNLAKSWHNFMENFITIRRRDNSAEPLLAPNQNIYLRENIRAQLLIATQTVPRHQTEIYKQSLETVSTWVRAYFDPQDPATKAFLDELATLTKQPISSDVPTQLKSLPLLEKLMQTRVRNLLAQNTDAPRER